MPAPATSVKRCWQKLAWPKSTPLGYATLCRITYATLCRIAYATLGRIARSSGAHLLCYATDRKAVVLSIGILRVRIACIVIQVVPISRSTSSTRPIVAIRAAIVERAPIVVAGAEEKTGEYQKVD